MSTKRWVLVGCGMVVCAVAVALVWLITYQPSDQQGLGRGVWEGPNLPSTCYGIKNYPGTELVFDGRQRVDLVAGDLACGGQYQLDATHQPPLLVIEVTGISVTYRYHLVPERSLTLVKEDGTVLTYVWKREASCGLC